ncbi:hypothetical protein Q9L58_000148 [Maublancomyces gigas]|uniref:MAGE domain-containing protein n=1 Tax=Discina gigas TaxID=1032678 RepID=A0ABR3GYY7_9PEZI
MPPLQSRKRRPQHDEDSDDQVTSPPQRRKLTQAQTQVQRRGGESSTQGARRNQRTASLDEGEEDPDSGDGGDGGDEDSSSTYKDHLVKKFVRFALASEYTRQPLKRVDINSKVLGSRGRMFKEIFEQSQKELRHIFGMELVELPMREKTKLSQRRAAQTSEKPSTSSGQYVLTTVLPEQFREYEIVHPHGFKEQTYTGLVTMIVSLIYLNGCILPENKLDRYLLRMNADEYTPVEKTEKVIAMMVKQGYIIKQKDEMGEGGHDYYLGPRAKVEIGSDGVLSMLKTVYGVTAPEDLERKLKRNIGIIDKAVTGVAPAGKKSRAGKKRTGHQDNDEDD